MLLFDGNRFHLLVLFTWQFGSFFAAQLLFPIFANAVPEWKCGDGKEGRDCDEYRRCGGNVTFITESPFESAAMEFGWICDGEHWKGVLAQLQFAGVLLGTVIFGAASDLLGRRPISIFALALGIATNLVTSRLPTPELLFINRFFVGICIGGVVVAVYTFVMELLLPQHRMLLRGFFNWGVARFFLTLICMLSGEWRAASAACALAVVPALLVVVFLLPESPTWLHSKGRLVEMRKSEMQIAKLAGVEYLPVEHRMLEKTKSICQVVQGGGLRRLLVLWVMWFTASTCSYATDLNSSSLSGNLFINQMLFAFFIWISKMLLFFLDRLVPHFSRRLLHQGAQLTAVALFAALSVLTLIHYKGKAILVINLLAVVFIEYTWDACYLCVVESMETAARASSTGSCSFVARLGALLSPSLAYMNHHWSASVYVVAVLLGSINFLSSFFFLVETKGVALDDVCVDEDERKAEADCLEEDSQEFPTTTS